MGKYLLKRLGQSIIAILGITVVVFFILHLTGNPVELNTIMAAMVNRNIDTDLMECFTASELQIESTEEIAWTLDGEFGGRHSRVEIQNYKQALEIRVPEEE